MSRLTLAHLQDRLQRPPPREQPPCTYCGGQIIELGMDERGAAEWGCLLCSRAPGPPRPHAEPDEKKTARWGRGFVGVRVG